MAPEDLPGRADADHFSGSGHQINVAGLAVHGGGPDRVTFVHDIAEVIVESELPNDLAGIRFQAGQVFPQVRAFPGVAEGVNPILGDNCLTPAGHFEAPQVILAAQFDLVGQSRFRGSAVLIGTPPVKPARDRFRANRPREDSRNEEKERELKSHGQNIQAMGHDRWKSMSSG